jgi:hypothetical protein
MSIAFRHLRGGMPERPTDHEQGLARVDQIAGEAVPVIPIAELAPLFRVPDYSEYGVD